MLYRSLLRPALFRLPTETAHELGLHAMTAGLGTNLTRRLAARRYRREPFGQLRRFGLSFANPVEALVTTGFCGALSTFSTFSYETVRLTRNGDRLHAVANVLISVLAGLGAVTLGVALGAA